MLSTTTTTAGIITHANNANPSTTFTAFLSNIPAGAPDDLLEAILASLGDLKLWRRLIEPSGAPKPCGFAEFSNQASLMTVSRLLPHIELYAGRRVSVKVDEQVFMKTAAASVEGEEGEVQSFKDVDTNCLNVLIALFSQRRMLHAVESSKRLFQDYDKIINAVQGEREFEEDLKEFRHKEDKWLKEEAKIFKEYHDYQQREDSKRDLEAEDERMINLFYSDRSSWRKRNQGDKDDESRRLKQLVDGLPVEPSELFAYSIEWSNFDMDRMKLWLVRQRGLLPHQADKIAGYMARRLTAHQITDALRKDLILDNDEDCLLFTIRLWRWIILDTQLHTE